MSELLKRQKLFMRLLPKLLNHIHELGYECTIGDGFRDPRVFGRIGDAIGYGHASSAHKRRLAIDIHLFRGDEYCSRTEDHAVLGEYWKSLDPLCRHGGDFLDPDGSHYSIEYEGYM